MGTQLHGPTETDHNHESNPASVAACTIKEEVSELPTSPIAANAAVAILSNDT